MKPIEQVCLRPSLLSRPMGQGVLLLCAATLSLSAAHAQGVHRVVGPDGRVTYQDLPPEPNSQPLTRAANSAPGAPSSSSGSFTSAAQSGTAMPLVLRQAMARYPVTLYSGDDCAPCNSGRNLLNARGIPFTEKTVTSGEDIAALKRMTGESAVPVLTIGVQQIKGFSDAEWSQFLDAAGYPRQSMLPSSYRRPAPSSLVEIRPLQAPPSAAPTTAPNPPAPRPAALPTAVERTVNPPVQPPPGIRF